jgi:hypothetical protein
MNWNIDATFNYAPIVDILTPTEEETISQTYNITWNTVDINNDNITTNVTISNGTNTTILCSSCSSYNFDTTTFDNGDYNLTVESCENDTTELYCGNDTHIITISQIPVITILVPSNGGLYSGTSVQLNVSANQVIDTWIYNINGTNVTFSPNTTLSLTSTGAYTVNVFGNNSNGLTGNASSTFNFVYVDAGISTEESTMIGIYLVLIAIAIAYLLTAFLIDAKRVLLKIFLLIFSLVHFVVNGLIAYLQATGLTSTQLADPILYLMEADLLVLSIVIGYYMITLLRKSKGIENEKPEDRTDWV